RRPESRHPSMEALIAAIDRVIEPRRGAWLVAAGLAAAVVGGGLSMAYQSGTSAQVCAAIGASEIAAVWSPERAAAIGAALRVVDPEADEGWQVAEARFNAYAAQWSATAVDACLAAEV